MKKILVTGASGFLGSAIVPELANMSNVIAQGHSRAGDKYLPVDLREHAAVKALLEEVQPDVVVHAAAYRDPDFCERDPEESARMNVASTRHLAELLPTGAQLVYISSDYVFDGKHPGYVEDSARCPINVYGAQKVTSEDITLNRENAAVLRIPVLIGKDLPGHPGFISKMRESIFENQQGEVLLDDVLMRFPTWIDDVARAIRFLIEQDAQGVFHGSSTHGGTRYALNQEMAGILGESFDHVRPSHEVVQRGAARPRDSQLNAEKLTKLGFSGFSPLKTVLEALTV